MKASPELLYKILGEIFILKVYTLTRDGRLKSRDFERLSNRS